METKTKLCTTCMQWRSLTEFYLDSRYRDGYNGRCRGCKNEATKAIRERQRSENYAARQAAKHKRAKAYARSLSRARGHWLAGFIDGEGCFTIPRKRRRDYFTYHPQFSLVLRADDRPVLEMIRKETGIGRIYDIPPPRKPTATNAAVVWRVCSNADSLALVAILDRFPLQSKKVRDYAIWREAVLEHGRIGGKRLALNGHIDWSRLEELGTQLVAGRQYAVA